MAQFDSEYGHAFSKAYEKKHWDIMNALAHPEDPIAYLDNNKNKVDIASLSLKEK